MKTYEAIVTVGGMSTKTQVSAKDTISAKKLIEAQYGKDNVKSGVYEVR